MAFAVRRSSRRGERQQRQDQGCRSGQSIGMAHSNSYAAAGGLCWALAGSASRFRPICYKGRVPFRRFHADRPPILSHWRARGIPHQPGPRRVRRGPGDSRRPAAGVRRRSGDRHLHDGADRLGLRSLHRLGLPAAHLVDAGLEMAGARRRRRAWPRRRLRIRSRSADRRARHFHRHLVVHRALFPARPQPRPPATRRSIRFWR